MGYHTTREENEVLTRVGAGTRMGELLRRYWWPVALADALKEKPTFIRLLCEDLVLYRDIEGAPAILGAHCAHRRANLCLGRVEPGGLRCRYHGWLYDRLGNVTEVPGDPSAHGIRQPSYLAQELGGLIFAYLGPLPAPDLPRYHILVAEGERSVHIQAFNDANWLQCAENGVDPVHPTFLHTDVWQPLAQVPVYWAERTPLGVVERAIRKGRTEGEFHYMDHPMVMPGIIFGGDVNVSYGREPEKLAQTPAAVARWSVPIDDTHTMNIRVNFRPPGHKKSEVEQRTDHAVSIPIEPYLEYKQGRSELGYTMPPLIAEQDATMLDSLGAISDRENEHLVRGDCVITMLRDRLFEDLEAVAQGGDPTGVIRTQGEPDMITVAGRYRWISTQERQQLLDDAGVEPF